MRDCKTCKHYVLQKNKNIYSCEKWECEYEQKLTPREWLSTFNTNSATECYTAVQRLKAEVEE